MELRKAIDRLAEALALAGGVILIAMMLVTIVSIVGRVLIPLGVSPILGDYEIIENLTGVAVFCFLPYCQLHRGHVMLDLFARLMGPRLVRVVDAVAEIVMAVVLALIAWRLTAGFLDKYANGELSLIKQFPIWWGYAASLVPSYAAVVVGLYTSWRAMRSVALGRDLLPEHQATE